MKDLRRLWPSILLAAACADSRAGGGKADLWIEARLPVAFGQVSNVVELGDGRVAFADTRDRLFLIGDLGTGKVDTLGSRVDSMPAGAAASIYKFPGWVAHLAGDTVALVDFAALRTTLWNERGEPLAPLALPPVAGQTPILAYDQRGFGYKSDYRAILGGHEPGGAVQRDSIPVLRIELATGRADTVARLAPPDYGDATFGEQQQRVAKIFGPNDVFGVLPDGRLWIARARENRVDWRDPGGSWVLGRAHEYARVPVTEADRARVLARIREQGKGHGLPDSLRLEWPFAEQKPPFEAGMASPAGEVWLQRPRPADGRQYVYDVYGPDGGWRRAVTFPPGATLAGFGRGGAVYAALTVEGGRTVARLRER